MKQDRKQGRYERIRAQLPELLASTDDRISRMATVAAVLHHKMDHFFWTGFYRHVDGQLLAGPYQGPAACQNLKKDTGVCWAGVNRRETIVVPDVHQFPGHIPCDGRSKSEIVVPCFDADGHVFAVLDVDSDKLDSFDQIDKVELEEIVKEVVR